MSSRRPILKRLALWTGATLVVFAGYALSAPIVATWCQERYPTAVPVVRVVWTPIWSYLEHKDWPGGRTYASYYSWSSRTLRNEFKPDARATLAQTTDLEFAETPLRDIVSYLGEIHDCRIDLEGAVNGDIEVSIHTSGTLGDALNRLLTPHGLVAAPVGRRIVIGTPEAVQKAADTFDHQDLIGQVIVIGILALCVAVAVWFVRRRVSRRRSADARTSS